MKAVKVNKYFSIENEIIQGVEVELENGSAKLDGLRTQLKMRKYDVDNADVYFFSEDYEDYIKIEDNSKYVLLPIVSTKSRPRVIMLRLRFHKRDEEGDDDIQEGKGAIIEKVVLKARKWISLAKHCRNRKGRINIKLDRSC